jgi:hypothetical protein
MGETSGLRLAPSALVKERRLQSLLQGTAETEPRLVRAVTDAQILGSLELAGLAVTWDEVREDALPAVRALRKARAAAAPGRPLDRALLLAWNEALAERPAGFRRAPRAREGAVPAPPEFVESRLAVLEQWLTSEGGQTLKPLAQAALALARIVEILPFDDGNGRISRLAASHLMVSGGLRPPILVGGDGPRLRAALEAAFRFETEPLGRLLEEASGRCLDVMIQTIEPRVP